MGKAGRPIGAISETTRIAQELRKKLAAKVEERWVDMERAMFDVAFGFWYEDESEDGKRTIYKTKPDTAMLKSLKEQVIGKAKETVELDNPMQNEQLHILSEQLKTMINDAKHK